MAQVGRISGPLLFANLERNGIDLAFRNDLQTTQLLYLDVNTGRIAVNNDAPAVDIDITGTTRTTDLIANESNSANVANFSIGDNDINVTSGDIFLNASEAVLVPNLETEQFYASDNTISTKDNDTSIELRPNGTGSLDVYNNLNIYGNLDTPGNITFDGTITFGDTIAQDTVDFNADVNSDIIPDVRNTYDLGSTSKRWNTLYTNLINGQSVSTQDIAAGGTVLNSRPGNIFYVAANGDDTNVGDHIQGPLASIQEALSKADASTSGPVVVHVLPGTYEEQLPLVIPSNVSIVGHDIRNVIVKPNISSQTQDVFHLNGETTIQNLTVKGFYYDDVNNTGYAFRYAPGAVISSRSPYVQDITVITQGTNTSQADPRGFYAGDAGKGAYINGAELDAASFDASMLFHSCTFITPGVDAITMTNGVRVEWLNSFTYFADRGLYAVDGLTGRTSQDGSTVVYGAEVRSIGSANVYGNFGAVADGADTLMYLIQHNMAYIGSAESAENDPSLVVQANEIVEQNSGQIYYVTTDHTGSFRVGDNFFIDFETGGTSVDLSSLTADTLTGLVITNADDTTTIDGRFIETGNFRIIDNTIQTLAGDVNVDSNTDTINLNNNSNVSGNLDIVGDFTFDGAISFAGDAPGDGVTFNVELEQNFNPNETMAFKLGSPSKEWLAAFLNRIEVGDISIYDNRISTKTSNADLELRANGTGGVRISDSATIDNNISVANISTFADVNVTGALNLVGDLTVTGDRTASNDLTVSQNIDVGAQAQFEEIQIDGNIITTTSSDADLELRASGTGEIITSQPVDAQQDLSFNDGTFGNNLIADLNLTANNANVSNIEINDNYIETTSLNANLELKSTQDISVPLNDTNITQDLTANGATDLQDASITGVLNHTGDRIQTGDYDNAGELFVDSVVFEDNFIGITSVDTDLELGATKNVVVPFNDVTVNNNLTVNGITGLQNLTITGLLNHTGTRTQTGNYDIAGELYVDDIQFEDNFVTSTGVDQNLELRADGDGIVNILANDVRVDNNLTVSTNTDLQDVAVNGTITHIGATAQIGNYTQTGNTVVDGAIAVDSLAQFENIQINGNVLQTTDSDSRLELGASGTGRVVFDDSVRVSNNLFTASITSGNIVIDQDLELNEIVIPPSIIEIDDNFISTTISNENLELRASGTGTVFVPSNDVTLENNLAVNGTTELKNTSVNGSITHTGSRTQTGNYTQTGSLVTSGIATISSAATINNVYVDGNRIDTSSGNLVLGASGTGNVVFENLQAAQDFTSGTLTTGNINIDGTLALEELESSTDIQIFDNVITTTNSNSDLELRANGAGDVALQDLKVNQNVIKTDLQSITLSPADNVSIAGSGALQIPVGTTNQILLTEIPTLDGDTSGATLDTTLDGGDASTTINSNSIIYDAGEAESDALPDPATLRFNSEEILYQGFNGGIVSFNGVYSDNRLTSVTAHPTNNTIDFTVDSVSVGTISSQEFSIHELQVEDINISNNSISTNVSNSDLELRTNGTGEQVIDNLSFIDSQIKNEGSNIVFAYTNNGYAKINSTGAAVIPTGTVAERPVADPEVGDTRFNTEDDVLEVWDGSTYVVAAGTSATISESEFNDLMFEYTLIFG